MLVWNCVHCSKQILGDISANPCRWWIFPDAPTVIQIIRQSWFSLISVQTFVVGFSIILLIIPVRMLISSCCQNQDPFCAFCVRGYISKATVLNIVAVWSPKNSASHLKRERRSTYYLFKPLHIRLAHSTPSSFDGRKSASGRWLGTIAALLLIRAGVPCQC